jgi:thioesterase domain-containing protein
VSPPELERYLHEHIPLTRAIGVSVLSVAASAVVLHAPLAPNINHRETVFGGSAAALALLAGWALLHVRLQSSGVAGRVVIQYSTMDYGLPIAGEFTARSSLEQPERWARFVDTLLRKGRARIGVTVQLEHAGKAVGRFTGRFVALGAG